MERRLRAVETQQTTYITDSDLNPKMQLGRLRDGGFGAAVYTAASGKFHRVNPPQADSHTPEISTTSTSWVTLGGPEVTVTVGEAGEALAFAGAIVGIDGGSFASAQSAQGAIGVSIDGNTAGAQWVASGSTTTLDIGGSFYLVPLQLTCSNPYLFGGLTQGSHTFRVVYRSRFGQSIHFSTSSLVVIPY